MSVPDASRRHRRFRSVRPAVGWQDPFWLTGRAEAGALDPILRDALAMPGTLAGLLRNPGSIAARSSAEPTPPPGGGPLGTLEELTARVATFLRSFELRQETPTTTLPRARPSPT